MTWKKFLQQPLVWVKLKRGYMFESCCKCEQTPRFSAVPLRQTRRCRAFLRRRENNKNTAAPPRSCARHVVVVVSRFWRCGCRCRRGCWNTSSRQPSNAPRPEPRAVGPCLPKSDNLAVRISACCRQRKWSLPWLQLATETRQTPRNERHVRGSYLWRCICTGESCPLL